MIHLKPTLVSLIKANHVSIFEIDEQLKTLSDAVKNLLVPEFSGYGLALEQFFITSVVKPEDDKNYRRFREIHYRQYTDLAEAKLRQQVGVIDQQTTAQRMVIEAQGLAQKRTLEGFTYQDERGFDVAERLASNQAVGQMANMGIGMGMIAGVGGTVGNQVGAMLQDTLGKNSQNAPSGQPAPAGNASAKCAKCGADLPANAKFCPQCGEKVGDGNDGTVLCSKCGAKVPGGKFCLNCGAPLQNAVCPKCGKCVQAGANFCPDCGEKIV